MTYSPSVLRALLRRYPNLYVDMSFGEKADFVRRSVEDLSFKHADWQKVMSEFPDRFLFGSDLVVGDATTLAYSSMVYEYLEDMLESSHYDFHWFPKTGFSRLRQQSHHRAGLDGLHLPDFLLRKMYFENAMKVYGGGNPSL